MDNPPANNQNQLPTSGCQRTAREKDQEASIEAGIERGLANVAAGRVLSSDECFNSIRAKLTQQYQ